MVHIYTQMYILITFTLQILKEVVDQFEPGKGIPSCQLIARVVESSKREPLIHTVNLEGAKEPYDVFTIHIEGINFNNC